MSIYAICGQKLSYFSLPFQCFPCLPWSNKSWKRRTTEHTEYTESDVNPPIAHLPGVGHNPGMARLRQRWRVVTWTVATVSIIACAVPGIVILLASLPLYILAPVVICGMATAALLLLEKTLSPPRGLRWLSFALTLGFFAVWSGSCLNEMSSRPIHWNNPLSLCWIPMLLFGLSAAYFWATARGRPQTGHGQSCRHDLTGNTSGTCPECGRAVICEERRASE
jgi:hypothetical protein